jgi:hypothetical protein
MKHQWVSGLEGKAKEEFEKVLNSSSMIFDKEDNILNSMIEAELTLALGRESFTGDWSHEHACIMGKIKAYKEVKSLLKGLTSY